MSPYFYQFTTPLLSLDSKRILVEFADNHPELFQQYYSGITNHVDKDVCFILLNTAPEFKKQINMEIENFLAGISLPFYCMILRHQPGVVVSVHRDDPNRRNTIISIPLQPLENYPPTHFYNFNGDTAHTARRKPIATAKFESGNACMLNTQELHGLVNTSQDTRYNFQICFHESWEVVYNLVLENKLFTENFS